MEPIIVTCFCHNSCFPSYTLGLYRVHISAIAYSGTWDHSSVPVKQCSYCSKSCGVEQVEAPRRCDVGRGPGKENWFKNPRLLRL